MYTILLCFMFFSLDGQVTKKQTQNTKSQPKVFVVNSNSHDNKKLELTFELGLFEFLEASDLTHYACMMIRPFQVPSCLLLFLFFGQKPLKV